MAKHRAPYDPKDVGGHQPDTCATQGHAMVQVGTGSNGQPKYECRRCPHRTGSW